MAPTMAPALLGVAGAAIFLLALLGLRMARGDALEGWDVGDIVLLRDQSKRRTRRGPMDTLAMRFAPLLARRLGPNNLARIRRRIDLAGRPDGMTLDTFLQLVTKYTLFLGTTALILLLIGNTVSALLCLLAVPVLPFSRLAGHQRRRQEHIASDLPDFLDILSVTVSAGIGFRTALGRVAQRFEGPLRDELMQTLHQLDVGVPRRQAFVSLRDRCGSEAMDSFVSAFLQAEELGAPLATTLNNIALDMRRESAQMARRKAARTVPRVTLVVSVVLVPPTLLIIMVGLYLGADIDLGTVLNG
ncbi:type II secretion system F family protein [Nocardioides mesophilus]|uniref:Type II secretion system F family protein n=1 Tax=Nocardioides mesophilus TaxID=433659 RepID=A0A7G9REY3_9ACTN|nr:type II secretion system F family protein [Nocardioides mesophilus]QNN54158.1 type II secretion system F family protein [Nocardioides mesophilus]